MKFGLNDTHWKLLESLLFEPLRKYGASIYIFGSRARGDHQKFSDLDILYSSEVMIPDIEVIDIKYSLEDRVLPIKVDLVNEKDFNENYRPAVLKERIRI